MPPKVKDPPYFGFDAEEATALPDDHPIVTSKSTRNRAVEREILPWRVATTIIVFPSPVLMFSLILIHLFSEAR